MLSSRSALVATLIAVSNLHAQPAPSQSGERRHSVVGIVVDSLRGRVLSGAQVILDGTIHSALTDSSGVFRFDSISAGDYRIGFFHAMLDSIGVSLPSRALTIPLDSGKAIVLAVPSSRTLIGALCPGNVGNGTSVLAGMVTDPETEVGVPGATISVKWTDIEVSKETGLSVTPREYVSVTDNSGAYRVCGLPDDFDARVSAIIGNVTTAEVPVESHRATVMTRSLTLATPGLKPAERNASLTGIIRSPDKKPLEGARVMLPGATATTISDKQGRFSLASLPSGTQSILVRRIGFMPMSVPLELSSKSVATVDIVMNKFVTSIDTVYVRARRTRDLTSVGFLQRRKRGIGDFRTRADFEKINPRYISDILRTMRGITVHPEGATTVITGRGQRTSSVQIFVDHAPWPLLVSGDLDDMIFPNDIAAIEVYDVSTTPPEFSVESCLTIVIWTRARIRDG